MKIRWYWFHFKALPVTVHLQKDRLLHWQWICGLQAGPWFVGAIRGIQANEVREDNLAACRQEQP
jgi:hypothetical protein